MSSSSMRWVRCVHSFVSSKEPASLLPSRLGDQCTWPRLEQDLLSHHANHLRHGRVGMGVVALLHVLNVQQTAGSRQHKAANTLPSQHGAAPCTACCPGPPRRCHCR